MVCILRVLIAKQTVYVGCVSGDILCSYFIRSGHLFVFNCAIILCVYLGIVCVSVPIFCGMTFNTLLYVPLCRCFETISVCMYFMLFFTISVVYQGKCLFSLCSLCYGIWFVSCLLVVVWTNAVCFLNADIRVLSRGPSINSFGDTVCIRSSYFMLSAMLHFFHATALGLCLEIYFDRELVTMYRSAPPCHSLVSMSHSFATEGSCSTVGKHHMEWWPVQWVIVAQKTTTLQHVYQEFARRNGVMACMQRHNNFFTIKRYPKLAYTTLHVGQYSHWKRKNEVKVMSFSFS